VFLRGNPFRNDSILEGKREGVWLENIVQLTNRLLQWSSNDFQKGIFSTSSCILERPKRVTKFPPSDQYLFAHQQFHIGANFPFSSNVLRRNSIILLKYLI